MIRAAEIADRIGAGWPQVLERLGVPAEHLVNRHGPCPACGGKDRFRFDNKRGRGDFFCNGCGAGDGFNLLMRVHGWDFKTARDRVAETAGVGTAASVTPMRPVPPMSSIAQPTSRVLSLWRQRCAVIDCGDAAEYLASRHCWPPPERCTLRAHPSVEYFDGVRRIGRYAALLADVRDLAGELVTLHVTYLESGRKLTDHEPRKLFSPLTGRVGCAVRLMPLAGETLGIGEGIETCLAAAKIHGVPTWSALNTSLLAKFEPPSDVKRLVVFADADVAGLAAAARLAERLQGRVQFEIKPPPEPAKDWNQVRQERRA